MSFIGFGSSPLNSNVNANYVNVGSTNNPSNFGSNEIPGTNGLPGLSGAKWNVDAAASRVPGICMSGGARKIKRKIKNITNKYKMKGGRSMKRKVRIMKSKIRSKYSKRRHGRTCRCKICNRKSRRHTRKMQRGGVYSQYQNNLPLTQTYSLGGPLSSSESALANPPPQTVLPSCTNCVDNYNHMTNRGFPSPGH